MASSNWSGKEANGVNGNYNYASFSWHVPCIVANSQAGSSSVWVGLGGDGNSNLVQTGTAQTISYFLWWPSYSNVAWTENFGDPSNPFERDAFNVNCGDSMYAYVQSGNAMFIEDARSGNYTSQLYGPAASNATAEFIVERPEVNGSLTNLADFNSVTLNSCTIGTVILDTERHFYLPTTTYQTFTMFSNDSSHPLDSVGSIDSYGNFTVTWQRFS